MRLYLFAILPILFLVACHSPQKDMADATALCDDIWRNNPSERSACVERTFGDIQRDRQNRAAMAGMLLQNWAAQQQAQQQLNYQTQMNAINQWGANNRARPATNCVTSYIGNQAYTNCN